MSKEAVLIFNKRQASRQMAAKPPETNPATLPNPTLPVLLGAKAGSLLLEKEAGSTALPMRLGPPSLPGYNTHLATSRDLFTVMVVEGVSEADYQSALLALQRLMACPDEFPRPFIYIPRAFKRGDHPYRIIEASFDPTKPPETLPLEIKNSMSLVKMHSAVSKPIAELREYNGAIIFGSAEPGHLGFHAIIKRAVNQLGSDLQLNSPSSQASVVSTEKLGFLDLDNILAKIN